MSRVTPEALHRHIDRVMARMEKEHVGIGPDGTIWVSGQTLRLRAVFDYAATSEGESERKRTD